LLGIGGVVVGGMSACTLLLPERLAFNAPIGKMLFGIGGGLPAAEQQSRLVAPPGYSVSVYAPVENARLLHFTAAGDLLVSSPATNSIWRLAADRDGDGRPDSAAPLPLELDRPHGLDLYDGHLYVGEFSRVRRVSFDEGRGEPTGALESLVEGLPEGENHWTKTVAIGPDDKLYVAVGSSCNVCIEQDERRAALLRYDLDGSGYELYASGLRNAVDFDWHPRTGALYATDNGRDLLGNDFPPCELNRVERGGFYGWPYANGDNVTDPDFGGQAPELEARAIAPAHGFRAHNAPLGIGFVSGPTAPAEYRDTALVALHGSWNRTEKDGYRVVSLHWDDDGNIEERDFLSGFEVDEDVIGRPVDAALGPDGAFYVSDDFADVVWRVARGDRASGAPPPAAERPRHVGPIDPQLSAAGAALYASLECASCHDPEQAAPGVVAKPIVGLSARYDAASLGDFFEAPTPPMPRFELDPAERAALAEFLLDAFGAPAP
jgi:glucose/arabinose dehydrogenase